MRSYASALNSSLGHIKSLINIGNFKEPMPKVVHLRRQLEQPTNKVVYKLEHNDRPLKSWVIDVASTNNQHIKLLFLKKIIIKIKNNTIKLILLKIL